MMKYIVHTPSLQSNVNSYLFLWLHKCSKFLPEKIKDRKTCSILKYPHCRIVIMRLVSCFIPPYHLSTWHTSCMYYWITYKILTWQILMVSQYMSWLSSTHTLWQKIKMYTYIDLDLWPWPQSKTKGNVQIRFSAFDIDLWPLNLTNNHSLGREKNQDRRSNGSNRRGWKLGRMDTAKFIIEGCLYLFCRP